MNYESAAYLRTETQTLLLAVNTSARDDLVNNGAQCVHGRQITSGSSGVYVVI